MSHYKIYVLKNVNNKEDRAGYLDELSMYESTKHFADYVEEENAEDYLEWLEDELKCMFGQDNVQADKTFFTVQKAGAVHYFESLRERVHRAIQIAMLQPIEDFVKIDLEKPGWWQIKEMLESNYDTHFYLDGYGCETRTTFAEDLLWIMKHEESVTFELRQVFDFHA